MRDQRSKIMTVILIEEKEVQESKEYRFIGIGE
jgi:hypothetical protein